MNCISRQSSAFESFVREADLIGAAGAEAEALIGKKEKGFVLTVVELGDPDGTADRSAEVILGVYRPFRTTEIIEPVVRVQFPVPQEIIAGTVQFIGAGFYRKAYNAIAGLPVFSGEVALQYAKFIHGVRGNSLVPLRIRRHQ